MTTNEDRRRIMLMAWSFRRAEPDRAFADCLRGAWAFSKRMAEEAGSFMSRARRAGGRVRMSPSLIRSPLGRRHGHNTCADFSASYTTALVGR